LFHPTLKLTDDTGCYVIVPFNDSLTVVVDSVGSQPVFSWPEPCDSNKVTFSTEGSVFSEKYLGATPTYQWDFGDPSSSNDVSPDSTATYRYPAAGTYQADLAITTRFGCSVTLPLAVVIPDSIPLTATASADPTEICAGNTIRLHAGSNLAETYLWSPATGLDNPSSPDPVATPPASTTYTVTTTSKGSCQTAQAQVSVVVHDNPVIDAGDDLTVPTGSVVTLAPTGSQDIISWNWSPAEYLSCTSCQSPTVTPRSNMLYTVQVANSFGCTSSDSLKLNLVCDEGKVFIPNTFTPNGDGQNDLFYPRGRGVKSVLYFRIYNRYGQLVFESTRFQLNDSSSGWNGTMQGKKLDPGVFIYTTEMVCDNDKIFKLSGNVTLLR
jgi:gliding motility-associated-like protein